MNRDKGPFRAAVSGLRRVAESEPWQKGSDGGVLILVYAPAAYTRPGCCPLLLRGGWARKKSTWAGNKLAGSCSPSRLASPGASNFYLFSSSEKKKNGHKNCPGDLTRVLVHSNERREDRVSGAKKITINGRVGEQP